MLFLRYRSIRNEQKTSIRVTLCIRGIIHSDPAALDPKELVRVPHDMIVLQMNNLATICSTDMVLIKFLDSSFLLAESRLTRNLTRA
jgi:hypothetical protein